MNVRALIAVLALGLPGSAGAQGFAGLGAPSEGFAEVSPGARLSFPADHGAHPDYRIEWWYLTANLEGPDGTPYGVQWTLFRAGLAPPGEQGGEAAQVWFAHAAVTTPEAHRVAERWSRGGLGTAGVTADPFMAWIDEWELSGPSFDAMRVTASAADFAYALDLDARGPLVLHGAQGYSVKSATGEASYYYSQPFYAAEGVLTLPEGEVAVSGTAWLDREWSSQPLEETQTGWDWFSLVFAQGGRLMGFRLRQADGRTYTSATWIAPDGAATAYPDGAFSAEPLRAAEVAGREIPVAWRVRLPERGVDVTVTALNEAAWNDTTVAYWEGPVTATGSHEGRGYLEMTGYE